MRISEAIEIVLDEQSVFDHVNTRVEAVRHVLDSLITQEEYEAGRTLVAGVMVMEGPDPDHPQFDAGYYAHKAVIDWYRMDISLADYLVMRIEDELGPDDWDPKFDSQEDALASGISAGIHAALMLDDVEDVVGEDGKEYEVDLNAQVPASVWAEALGDSDPAMSADMPDEDEAGGE